MPSSFPLPTDLKSKFDGVIISPGPGTVTNPSDVNSSADLFAHYVREVPLSKDYSTLPILGVCLGHQLMGYYASKCDPASIQPANQPMHGRIAPMTRTPNADVPADQDILAGLDSPFDATLYHSLALSPNVPLSSDIVVTATGPANTIQAIQHKKFPHFGVQFHPESIGTTQGKTILKNFVNKCAAVMASRAAVMASKSTVDTTTTTTTAASPAPSIPPTSSPLPEKHVHISPPRSIPSVETLLSHLSTRPNFVFLDSSSKPAGSHSIIANGVSRTVVDKSDPFTYLADKSTKHSIVKHGYAKELPFYGGSIGYLSYDLRGDTADAVVVEGEKSQERAEFCAVDSFYIIDHDRYQLYGVAPTEDALASLMSDLESIENVGPIRYPRSASLPPAAASFEGRSKDSYTEAVRAAKHQIKLGNTYEVCLTNTRTLPYAVNPSRVYSKLRQKNPAPYAAFLNFGNRAVCCSSPERFVAVSDGRVESKPIKGTAKRDHSSPENDEAIKTKLRESVKDRAENLMIVDLVRNDFSRCCSPPSVAVSKLCAIESYATVHQMVSTITGSLHEEHSVVDVIKSAFPGGSMTGAPKKRTMEIIDSLETEDRGVYSGSIGYIGYDGRASFNIVIRTAVVDDVGVKVGCGGAITWLSNESEEYDEMRLKGGVVESAVLDAVREEKEEIRRDSFKDIRVKKGDGGV
jgi:para-aminobenzoate synthetase